MQHERKMEQIEESIIWYKKLNLDINVFVKSVRSCDYDDPDVNPLHYDVKDIQSKLGVELTAEIMKGIPIEFPNVVATYTKYYKDFIDHTERKDWVAFLEFVTGVGHPPEKMIFLILHHRIGTKLEDIHIKAATCSKIFGEVEQRLKHIGWLV